MDYNRYNYVVLHALLQDGVTLCGRSDQTWGQNSETEDEDGG